MSTAEELNSAAFRFVQGLAADLNKEDLDLPGFPDTVVMLHQDLSDESKAVSDIVERIKTEPALSARLIQIANSAAFNTSGREVSEPRAAITQLGFNVVRSTATTYAMRQMEQQEWLEPLRPELAKIWRRSNGVAATCHVLGASISGLRPDEAMATGLFHQLGNLYLLTKAHQEGLSVAENDGWEEITAQWHPTIARAFMESWGMPAHLGEAVENQDCAAGDDTADHTLLSRLLSAAKLLDSLQETASDAAATIEEKLSAVKLSGNGFMDLVQQKQDQIAAVRQAISSA